MGRPRGTIGEVARAMRDAAAAGPGTVRQLAERAQVGQRCAWYTTTRLVQAGELVRQSEPGRRPTVLALRQDGQQPPGADLAAVLAGWR